MPIQLRYLDVKLRKISLFKAPGHLLTDVSLSPCWKTHLTKSIIHVFAIGILCDLPWQWHVEWSLHWLSLLVTSCGGSLGPHQPYKGCVKQENCMVLCSHSDCGWEVEASLNLTLPPLQPRMGVLAFMVIWSKSSNSVKKGGRRWGMNWTGLKERCEEQWPLNGDCISLLFRSSDMAEERAIYSLLSSHSEIVSMRCRSPFLWFFYVLFVGLIQRCTVVFLTGCVSRLKRAKLWWLLRKIFDKTVRLGKQVLLEVFTLT